MEVGGVEPPSEATQSKRLRAYPLFNSLGPAQGRAGHTRSAATIGIIFRPLPVRHRWVRTIRVVTRPIWILGNYRIGRLGHVGPGLSKRQPFQRSCCYWQLLVLHGV